MSMSGRPIGWWIVYCICYDVISSCSLGLMGAPTSLMWLCIFIIFSMFKRLARSPSSTSSFPPAAAEAAEGSLLQ